VICKSCFYNYQPLEFVIFRRGSKLHTPAINIFPKRSQQLRRNQPQISRIEQSSLVFQSIPSFIISRSSLSVMLEDYRSAELLYNSLRPRNQSITWAGLEKCYKTLLKKIKSRTSKEKESNRWVRLVNEWAFRYLADNNGTNVIANCIHDINKTQIVNVYSHL
jgi:hypothetical protein